MATYTRCMPAGAVRRLVQGCTLLCWAVVLCPSAAALQSNLSASAIAEYVNEEAEICLQTGEYLNETANGLGTMCYPLYGGFERRGRSLGLQPDTDAAAAWASYQVVRSDVEQRRFAVTLQLLSVYNIDTVDKRMTFKIRQVEAWNTSRLACKPYESPNGTYAAAKCTDPPLWIGQATLGCYLAPPLVSPKRWAEYWANRNSVASPVRCAAPNSIPASVQPLDNPAVLESARTQFW